MITLRRLVRRQTAALREHAERAAGLEKDYLDRLEAMVWERTQELESAQEQLVQKERLATLGRLTATVSHELRNPLATVRGSIFLLADAVKDAPPVVQRALKRAEQNIIRCDGIIDELLEYARVRELACEPTELDPWIDRSLADVRVGDGIELVRDLASGAVVSFDSLRMLRCLINLVENASQAITGTHGGARQGSRIGVSTRVLDGHAVVRVADDGPGIPAADQSRVFEPFFSTKSFGLGLGLAIVRQIVERHGGRVELESRPGATVFSLRLLLYPLEAALAKGGG